jgi:hypothetical protein
MKKVLLALLVLGWCSTAWADYTQDANCVGAWLMEEGTGSTTLNDSSSGGNDATGYITTPTWDNATLPGTFSTWVTKYFGAWKTINYKFGTGDFSLCVYWNISDNSGTYVAMGEISGGDDVWLGISTGYAQISANGNGLPSSSLAGDGEWHQITGLRNSGNFYIYVDGVASGPFSNSGGINPDGGLTIGRFGDYEYFWGGYLDESAVFTRALSSTEINDIMDNGLTGGGAPAATPTLISAFDQGFDSGFNQGVN